MKKAAWILLVIGGLNLGLSAFGLDILSKIFGSSRTLLDVIYILIGLSALWELFAGKKMAM